MGAVVGVMIGSAWSWLLSRVLSEIGCLSSTLLFNYTGTQEDWWTTTRGITVGFRSGLFLSREMVLAWGGGWMDIVLWLGFSRPVSSLIRIRTCKTSKLLLHHLGNHQKHCSLMYPLFRQRGEGLDLWTPREWLPG